MRRSDERLVGGLEARQQRRARPLRKDERCAEARRAKLIGLVRGQRWRHDEGRQSVPSAPEEAYGDPKLQNAFNERPISMK